jgi:hypothetical protein
MDPLGDVVRQFLSQQREDTVKTAVTLAADLRKESMNRDQAEEMLYGAGYESEVVDEAIKRVFDDKKK